MTRVPVNSEQKLEQIEKLLQALEHETSLKAEESETHYTFLEEASLKLQKRVSDIIRQVEFNHDTSDKSLMQAIYYFKDKNGNVDKHAPLEFLEEKDRKHVFEDNTFKISLYKTLFFKAVCDGVKAGTLNLRYSHKYRYLDEYLIAKTDWKQNKAEYLKRAELEKFADVGTMFRKAEGRHARAFQADGRAIKEKVRLYARVGTALIAARDKKEDAFDAITAVIPWDRFRASVAEAEALARSEEFDSYQMLGEHYACVRRWSPAFLATFAFQGVPAAASLLRAIDMLRDMNTATTLSLQKSAPTGFIRERWARHVLAGGPSTGATTSCVCCRNCAIDCVPAISGSWAAGATAPSKSASFPARP